MQFRSWEVWCSSQKTCFQSGSVTWIQQASTQSARCKEALTGMAKQGQVRSWEGVSPEMCHTCLLASPLSSYFQAMFRISGLFLLWGNVSHYRTTELCITISRLQKELWSEDLEASEASQDTWGFWGSVHCRILLWSYKAWYVPEYILAGALSQYQTERKWASQAISQVQNDLGRLTTPEASPKWGREPFFGELMGNGAGKISMGLE